MKKLIAATALMILGFTMLLPAAKQVNTALHQTLTAQSFPPPPPPPGGGH